MWAHLPPRWGGVPAAACAACCRAHAPGLVFAPHHRVQWGGLSSVTPPTLSMHPSATRHGVVLCRLLGVEGRPRQPCPPPMSPVESAFSRNALRIVLHFCRRSLQLGTWSPRRVPPAGADSCPPFARPRVLWWHQSRSNLIHALPPASASALGFQSCSICLLC